MSTFLYSILSYKRMALVLITHPAPPHQGILSDLLEEYKKTVVVCADDWMSSCAKPLLAKNLIDGSESWKATAINPEN